MSSVSQGLSFLYVLGIVLGGKRDVCFCLLAAIRFCLSLVFSVGQAVIVCLSSPPLPQPSHTSNITLLPTNLTWPRVRPDPECFLTSPSTANRQAVWPLSSSSTKHRQRARSMRPPGLIFRRLTHGSFRALCVGSKPPWTYRLTSFDRLIDGVLIEGGDITNERRQGRRIHIRRWVREREPPPRRRRGPRVRIQLWEKHKQHEVCSTHRLAQAKTHEQSQILHQPRTPRQQPQAHHRRCPHRWTLPPLPPLPPPHGQPRPPPRVHHDRTLRRARPAAAAPPPATRPDAAATRTRPAGRVQTEHPLPDALALALPLPRPPQAPPLRLLPLALALAVPLPRARPPVGVALAAPAPAPARQRGRQRRRRRRRARHRVALVAVRRRRRRRRAGPRRRRRRGARRGGAATPCPTTRCAGAGASAPPAPPRPSTAAPARPTAPPAPAPPRRRRSPPPSRPRSGSRSRGDGSREGSPRFRRRRSLPNQYRRYERMQQQRRPERWAGGGARGGEDGRLGGFEEDWEDGAGDGIVYKGRGAMKYREKRRG